MNPVFKLDAQWASRLAEAYPEAAEQVEKLAAHMAAKQERLFRLIQFCAARPELDMMRMYAEYNAALDAVALEPPRETEVSDEEAKQLGPAQRAGRTKRLRTRAHILSVASRLLRNSQMIAVDEVCKLAEISEPTFYNRFRSRPELVAAAYGYMIDNG